MGAKTDCSRRSGSGQRNLLGCDSLQFPLAFFVEYWRFDSSRFHPLFPLKHIAELFTIDRASYFPRVSKFFDRKWFRGSLSVFEIAPSFAWVRRCVFLGLGCDDGILRIVVDACGVHIRAHLFVIVCARTLAAMLQLEERPMYRRRYQTRKLCLPTLDHLFTRNRYSKCSKLTQ